MNTEMRLKLALARLTDSFLEKHGCFPLDNAKWRAAMTEAYALIGQPNTPARTAALAEISSEPATGADGKPVVHAIAKIEVPFERVTNCLIGAIEGGSTYWLNAFQSLPASADIRADLKSRDLIWYAEDEFWTRGGGAHLEFDKPTEDSSGQKNIGIQDLTDGLSVMARIAPRHFGDMIQENDDAITHDVFLQCVLFGEIIFG